MAALRRSAAAAASVVARAGSGTSPAMSTLAAFPYWQKTSPSHADLVCTNGMEVDLNYSLLPDGIVAGGDAWRNPSTKALLMYTDSSVTKSKAVVSKATVKDCPQFATDAYEGFAVMDVGQFEELDAAVKDDLYDRKRMFVHDGVLGSERSSQTRVRVVTDSPDVALFVANMLHSTPLYNAETFPRNIVVVANTQWAQAEPVVASDVNLEAEGSVKCTVVAAGPVPFQAIARHIAHCGAQLASASGWTNQPGGGAPALAAVETGTRELYVEDRHWRPASGAAPGAVHLPATALAGAKGGISLVFGSGVDVPAAAHADKKVTLVAAHHSVWSAGGVSRAWAGLSVPEAAVGGAEALPRGAICAGGLATLAFDAPAVVAHPVQVIVVGGKAKPTLEDLAATLGGEAAERFLAQAKGVKLVHAKTAAAAIKAAAGV